MKILVTGGAGFIGSHIVEFLQQRAEVRVLDDFSSGFQKNLDGLKCEMIRGSILEREKVERALDGIDFVFHLAAMVSVPESVENPERCNEINSVGTRILLEAAMRAKVKKFIFSSSAAIYGNNPVVPKVETMTPEPQSPYARTKLEGENFCEQFTREFSLPTACLRYFNVFGPRQNPEAEYAAAIPIFIKRALRNEPVTIYGDGGQTRDFISVRDVAAANAFFALESEASGIFNIASGSSITVLALAEKIKQLTHSSSEIIFGPERAGDVRHSMSDTSQSTKAGFAPRADFESELETTLQWFRHQQSIELSARVH